MAQDCYAIPNPAHGQRCTDTSLGDLVFNATDGTWEKVEYYTQAGETNGAQVTAGSFLSKYGIIIVGAAVFLVSILLLSQRKKK